MHGAVIVKLIFSEYENLHFHKLFKYLRFKWIMEITINTVHQNVLKLQRQIELLNRILLNEGKITLWAKRELTKARVEKEESYTSLNDL